MYLMKKNSGNYKMLSGKIFFFINFILYISVLNYSSYIEDVHDCSNMAVEQYYFLKSIGFNDVFICCGEFTESSHAWLSVNGYEYDSVSLLPMWFYRINNPQYGETRYHIVDPTINHAPEWQPNYISYLNSIPMLFILFLINILRIKVIRPVINHANA